MNQSTEQPEGDCKITRHSRRKVLQGAAVALPVAWSPPLIRAVVLPAHAQTSEIPQPPGFFTINANLDDDIDRSCSLTGFVIRVFGTVSGGDLSGVVLDIEYTNGLSGGDAGSVTTGIAVQPGNTFDVTFEAVPPSGQLWADGAGLVSVRFQDQSTFGAEGVIRLHECFFSV